MGPLIQGEAIGYLKFWLIGRYSAKGAFGEAQILGFAGFKPRRKTGSYFTALSGSLQSLRRAPSGEDAPLGEAGTKDSFTVRTSV